MDDTTDILTRMYERFNARDINGVFAHLAHDVVWANGMEGGHCRVRIMACTTGHSVTSFDFTRARSCASTWPIRSTRPRPSTGRQAHHHRDG